jgi:hypothetical protein
MEIDKILIMLLRFDGNDANFLSAESRRKFERLIILLMRVKYNIRYCDSLECECQPETSIRELLEDENLAQFLKGYELERFVPKEKNLYELLKNIHN